MIYLISKALLIKAICIWDPVITDEEWEYYGSLKFQRASYPFMEGENTFYYMPHCDLPVYEGLLLSKTSILFGNNLNTYRVRDLQKFKQLAPTLDNRLFKTIAINAAYIRNDVFNDCCLMYDFL